MMEKLGKTPQEMADYLNKESGVLGITGISSDMREIEAAEAAGNERAILALKMYNYRIKKYIGAYAAAHGWRGCDCLDGRCGRESNHSAHRCRGKVLTSWASRWMLRRTTAVVWKR